MSDLKLTVTDNPKFKGRTDRYTITIASEEENYRDRVLVSIHPRFSELQALHLQLTKILLSD